MLVDIFRQFNWVDILVIILYGRILYISFKGGFLAEIFKLFGIVFAIYLAMHYYTFLADLVGVRMPIAREKTPLEFLDFVVFLGLSVSGYLLWFLLRLSFSRLIKIEAVPSLHKWGGLILGTARAYLLAGLIIFMLAISSIGYLKNSVAHAYFGRRLFQVAPNAYSWVWETIASKFMAQEKFNETVLEVEDGFKQ